MGAINNAFNQASWSVVQLASAVSKYISRRNKEGQNRAKQSYNLAATIKKQNNELTKSTVENTKPFFGANYSIPPERDEQKIAEQEVLEKMAEEKTKVTRFGELAGVEEAPDPNQKYISSEEGAYSQIKAENTETKIPVDEDVQGLIQAKQKNALKAASSKRSQERYQNIKEKLTYRFADEHNIDDVWRNISLDPNITDEMIKKAGFTKTKILEEWKRYKDSPTDWLDKQNIRGEEYGIVGGTAEAEDFSSFGRLLSAYIKAKAEGKTLAQQEEEYYLSKVEEEPEEKNYKVWQDESTEEEKDEVKTDRNFDGMFF